MLPPRLNHLPDDTLEPVLVPLNGLVLVDLVVGADLALGAPALGNTLTRAGPVKAVSLGKFGHATRLRQPLRPSDRVYAHAAVEVHAVDTNARVVLDAEIDVLADTETEVAGLGEVALPQLVLLDLEATLENLLGLGATDGDVNGDLFVTADTEGTDGVAGLACKAHVSQGAAGSVGWDVGEAYCRRGFDRTAARAPWRHE